MKISFVVAVYNEEATIATLLSWIFSIDYKTINDQEILVPEVIVANDGSTDRTLQKIAEFIESHSDRAGNLMIIDHKINRGKGAALRAGLAATSGEIVITQDADLEYDPTKNLPKLLSPFFDYRRAEVVYGSRFLAPQSQRAVYYWHMVGNKFITTLTNIFAGVYLTDIETGYKVFRRPILEKILPHLRSNTFDIEPELTILMAHFKPVIYEVPIDYTSRTYEEGKKIKFTDGLVAVWRILLTTWRCLFIKSKV